MIGPRDTLLGHITRRRKFSPHVYENEASVKQHSAAYIDGAQLG